MREHAKFAVQRFSPTDRRRLERAVSVAHEARLYRRIEAVLLVAEGQPISEAARRVRATRFSVRGWVGRYLSRWPKVSYQVPKPEVLRGHPGLAARLLRVQSQ